jgi:hypothetical protein
MMVSGGGSGNTSIAGPVRRVTSVICGWDSVAQPCILLGADVAIPTGRAWNRFGEVLLRWWKVTVR